MGAELALLLIMAGFVFGSTIGFFAGRQYEHNQEWKRQQEAEREGFGSNGDDYGGAGT